MRNITTTPNIKNLTYKPVLSALDRETLQGRNLVDDDLQEHIPIDVEANARVQSALADLGTTKKMMSCTAEHLIENLPDQVP